MSIDTAIIVAVIAALASLVVALATNYFTKKNLLNFEKLKLKREYYLDFIKSLSKNMNELDSEAATIESNHAFNALTIVASPEVLNALYTWQNLVIMNNKLGDIPDYPNEYTKLLTKLVYEIRIDLYGADKEELPDIFLPSGILPARRNEE